MCAEKLYASVILPIKFAEEIIYAIPPEMEAEAAVGKRVTAALGKKLYVGVIERILNAAELPPCSKPIDYKEIIRIVPGSVTPLEIEFWHEVANYYLCTAGEVFKAAYPPLALEQEEVKSKLMPDKIYEKARSAGGGAFEGAQVELSDAQGVALREIREQIAGRPVVLNGVAGSGKTEIYIALAREYLARGKSVLYLAPEIAMSGQLEARLKRSFGARLAAFHSAKTPAQKKLVRDLLRFEAPDAQPFPVVVLGTRSALFLPFRNLGLIIIDDEHDSSYKQEEPSPRYNAKNAAMFLSRLHKADVLLGSATPSLDTLYNCKLGKYAKVELGVSYFGAPRADIRIIDAIGARKTGRMQGELSQPLINEINRVLDRKEQVLVFRAIRSGAEAVEEELKALFPNAAIARYDSDVVKRKREAAKILQGFENGTTDILVGTQIMTKGFDFKNLTLIAVVQADSILSRPDFRADEKGFQLLYQLLGRCGRRATRGEFIIQTARKNHPVFTRLLHANSPAYAGSGSQTGFWPNYLSELLAERLKYRFPPFVRMVNVIVRHRNLQTLSELAQETLNALKGSSDIRALDISAPFTPKNEMARGLLFQLCITVKFARDKNLISNKLALLQVIDSLRFKNLIIIDVDPA